MKKTILSITLMISSTLMFAQKKITIDKDSVITSIDTLKVGNFYIIQKGSPNNDSTKPKSGKNWKFEIDLGSGKTRERKLKNIETNWWVFDLGFAGIVDKTNYTNAQAGNYLQVIRPTSAPVTEQSMQLKAVKTSNVNIWVFMQKLNLANHKLNLKYGMGYEMYNFRYERSLSYRANPQNMVFNDSISFRKNKLFAGYLTVPVMLNYTANPKSYKSFSFSGGLSVSYLLNSYNKQISNERGKTKERGNLDLEPFKAAFVTEIGLGVARIYGSYSLNNLFKSSTRLEQYPFTLGVRFSNW